jgi:ATP-dependent protease HslVU (ClpYQ) peptidase subunit
MSVLMTTDSLGDTDHELLRRLEQVATTLFGGHVTIMRFSSNWRVGFGTPADRHDITAMADGRTFAEAAHKALQRIRDAARADITKRRADVEAEFMADVGLR